MSVLHSLPELSAIPGPVVLAIGVFDGVHLGHRAVIERALADARQVNGTAVVVTFDPHPIRILRPEHAPRLLTSTGHKIRLIRDLGVEHLLILPFTPELACTPPEDFIRSLAHACRPLIEICVGHQWSFGKGRAGNLDLLNRLGDELGFDEVGVHAVQVGDQIVSSTLVRRAVESGDLATAALFLGRPYPILGTVTEGDRLGRTIGFPTANLGAHNEQFPPNGVYAVDVDWCGKPFRGVANIGVRPTIANASGQRIIEVHLFDFNAEIYGENLEVTFRRFLRPEMKFASLEALRAQIVEDVTQARA
ncbi:MAG: Riboflavin biosynthesis protein [Chthoniobacteraceae bacterium]|nr:Riboflavin biosynthesis protein [Chthoniobacteraceae bacterium]